MEKFSDFAADKGITEGLTEAEGRLSFDEAYKTLDKINADFRGNTFDIPLEDYGIYLKAARDYLTAVENLNQTSPNNLKGQMSVLAQKVIAEAPRELAA